MALKKPPHAYAAHLLVMGQGQMEGGFQVALKKFRQQGQDHGDETLHVGGAAPVEPVFDPRHL
jgi:hypothetical protein